MTNTDGYRIWCCLLACGCQIVVVGFVAGDLEAQDVLPKFYPYSPLLKRAISKKLWGSSAGAAQQAARQASTQQVAQQAVDQK
jgi:hypothetical protein